MFDPLHKLPRFLAAAWQRIYEPWRVEGEDLRHWRERILFSMYLCGVVLGLVAYVPGTLTLVRHGRIGAVMANSVFYLFTCFVLFFPKRFSLFWRSLWADAMLLLVGISVLSSLGPYSGGFVWVFSSAVMTSLLLGVRASIYALGVTALTLTGLGVMIFLGLLPWSAGGLPAVTPWVSASLNLLFLNAVTAVSAATMMRGLEHTLTRQRRIASQLDHERQELIQARTQLEEEVTTRRTAEEKYRNLAEHANDGIAMIHAGRMVYVNPKLACMLGYEVAEMLERPFTDFTDPAETDRLLARYNRPRAGEPMHVPLDTALRRKDGQRLEVDLNGGYTPYQGAKAELLFIRDISRRVAMEAEKSRLTSELRETSSLLESILDAIPDVIGVQDREHRILRYNAAGYRLLDKTAEVVIGRRCHELIGQSLPCGKCATQEVYQTLQPAMVEKYIPELERWFDVRSYPILNEKGELERVIEHLRDITREKQAEAEREKLEAQLHQAQKMEAVGTLAGGIAHDFNNLLMGIQGRASLTLYDLEKNHPAREHIEGISEHVKRAAALTSQLLGFARGGKYEIRPTDLNTLIARSVEMFGRTHRELTVQTSLQPNLWTVNVDRNQIDQVLLNLFLNAWQAMPGGGHLSVETSNHPAVDDSADTGAPGAPSVRIAVSDSGIGMDAETQARIFEPFFTTKAMGQGSGMGLASVYGIVKNHGGHIQVHSEKGRGTTFTITLPATDIAPAAELSVERTAVRGEGTVLLVDDEKMILDVGRMLLMRLGYRVITAQGGKEALERYRENSGAIDLVILDMIMPGFTGSQTFDQLKALDGQVRVLLSSGYSLDGEAKAIMERGCAGFLQKPFDIEELSVRLQEVIRPL